LNELVEEGYDVDINDLDFYVTTADRPRVFDKDIKWVEV
jgi:hypothetical protein